MLRVPPLYQRTPPLWARWTYALVACDIFMTASAVDLTWNHWTHPGPTNPHPTTTTPDPQPDPPVHFVPRPTWQRLALCLVHLGVGVGAAVALIGSHARVVRTLCILPPGEGLPLHPGSRPRLGPDVRRVFVQCAHNRKHTGTVFPLAQCKLHPGRDATELILRVKGMRGHWWIGLEGAVIEGQGRSAERARKMVLDAWRGVSKHL